MASKCVAALAQVSTLGANLIVCVAADVDTPGCAATVTCTMIDKLKICAGNYNLEVLEVT